MNCPVDGTVLQMAERSGIEIDYCPSCRGVWLDRGELDKLIERASPSSGPPPPAYRDDRDRRYDDRDQHYDRDRRYDDRGDHGYGKPHKKKRGGFLGEVFDFD